jgi:hypothetical protein
MCAGSICGLSVWKRIAHKVTLLAVLSVVAFEHQAAAVWAHARPNQKVSLDRALGVTRLAA